MVERQLKVQALSRIQVELFIRERFQEGEQRFLVRVGQGHTATGMLGEI